MCLTLQTLIDLATYIYLKKKILITTKTIFFFKQLKRNLILTLP